MKLSEMYAGMQEAYDDEKRKKEQARADWKKEMKELRRLLQNVIDAVRNELDNMQEDINASYVQARRRGVRSKNPKTVVVCKLYEGGFYMKVTLNDSFSSECIKHDFNFPEIKKLLFKFSDFAELMDEHPWNGKNAEFNLEFNVGENILVITWNRKVCGPDIKERLKAAFPEGKAHPQFAIYRFTLNLDD